MPIIPTKSFSNFKLLSLSSEPNKIIDACLSEYTKETLWENVAAMAHAILAAHLVAPKLHKVLEQELPFFDSSDDPIHNSQDVYRRIRLLLEKWWVDIVPSDLELASWMVIQIIKSLVHTAVIDRPEYFTLNDVEKDITRVIMGYLTFNQGPI